MYKINLMFLWLTLLFVGGEACGEEVTLLCKMKSTDERCISQFCSYDAVFSVDEKKKLMFGFGRFGGEKQKFDVLTWNESKVRISKNTTNEITLADGKPDSEFNVIQDEVFSIDRITGTVSRMYVYRDMINKKILTEDQRREKELQRRESRRVH